MTINRKPTGTASSMPAGLAVGTIAAVTITIFGSLITAKLIEAEIMKWEHSGYAVLIILLTSAWISGQLAAGKIKRQRLMVCLLSGAVYFCALLLSTALFFGGQYSGVGETGVLILCGSLVSIITGYSGKAKRNRPRNRIQNR